MASVSELLYSLRASVWSFCLPFKSMMVVLTAVMASSHDAACVRACWGERYTPNLSLLGALDAIMLFNF